jgi:hypothetical protein
VMLDDLLAAGYSLALLAPAMLWMKA